MNSPGEGPTGSDERPIGRAPSTLQQSLDYWLGRFDAKLSAIQGTVSEMKEMYAAHEASDRAQFSNFERTIGTLGSRVGGTDEGRFITAEGPTIKNILNRLQAHDDYNIKQDRDNAVARGIMEWKLKAWSILSPIVISVLGFLLYHNHFGGHQ